MLTARSRSYLPLCLSLLTGCAPAVRTPAPPAPIPAAPGQKEPPPPTLSWSFSYLAGISRYRVVREASIQNQTDSGTVTEATSNFTHERLTLERVGDTIQFSIAADTFATTTRTPSNAVQPPVVPSEITGTRVGDILSIVSDTLSANCNPVESVLASDIHNLLTSFPSQLTRGMTWGDSVQLTGCQGTIPTLARISRGYRVAGDTLYEGSPVVVIERTDTIQAKGEGAQQQHQLYLSAIGSGAAVYYLDPATGRVAHLTTSQNIQLTIAVSGKTHHFKQDLKQQFVLVR